MGEAGIECEDITWTGPHVVSRHASSTHVGDRARDASVWRLRTGLQNHFCLTAVVRTLALLHGIGAVWAPGDVGGGASHRSLLAQNSRKFLTGGVNCFVFCWAFFPEGGADITFPHGKLGQRCLLPKFEGGTPSPGGFAGAQAVESVRGVKRHAKRRITCSGRTLGDCALSARLALRFASTFVCWVKLYGMWRLQLSW